MRTALEDITTKGSRMAKLMPGELVLDIGCNDGTLLRTYHEKNVRRVGFEPAANLIDDARKGTDFVFNEFFSFDVFHSKFPNTKAKIITSIAMFYDLDDPSSFIADVSKLLAPSGVWIVQQNYLPTMLEQNGFDNIGHEHLTYYSLQTMSQALSNHDLEIFDVEKNDVNGGSFRTYISHKGEFQTSRNVLQVTESETKLFSRQPSIYDSFAKNVELVRKELHKFVTEETKHGKTIYVYGASTRGNTILQYCKLDHKLIQKATDANPEKWGRKTPGTGIPIVSKEEARRDHPDYFLVLPHHFLNEISNEEDHYLRSGGKLIVPLPHFRLVSNPQKVS